ncbi:3-phosphoshikimate 1-carboxyvinyltransferase [Sinimarinibacterium sp. CAU 1509]|uniref:3-phosphoshikimate 1-carboxyvinyltransferase n=1 Tax=Sinimarinibacterium sp. CAU 1509 TaxID=2562283 RepID=UPI0010ACF526|nr:3-phosphoshikimate 1-carboxyvinyltransferase [Sinimarinibacterium sp. CAU 1509]TJY62215.1 3-phosphoshikimate 1-carboxyvinyltransferase [Sinimarinibacterium sp. CAU 1509]
MSKVTFQMTPGGTLSGALRVPGDKSISHRAVMFGALAQGITEVEGFLTGEDCLCTMQAFRAMGVDIEQTAPTQLRIKGVGLQGLRKPQAVLDLGNSGTSMRLMAGLLAGQAFSCTLTGDASLSRRPMKRVIEPLTRMGASIESDGGRAPLVIHPVTQLQAIRYESPVASAQIKSCVLLAGLYAQGRTEVFEPEASRDHTERMLRAFGVEVAAHAGYAAIDGGQSLHATRVQVPADISSAAFFLVGAAIAPGSDVVLRDVGINPTRTGIIEVLRQMGADIQIENERMFGGEPVADLHVRGGELHGIEIGRDLVAASIDEFPAIFIAAACAEGETVVTGAEELRVKESDRIQTMCDGLNALGIDAIALPDGMRVQGGTLKGGTIDSHGDHRIAMSFAVAALRAAAPITILDCANVNTSFPGFASLARDAGLRIEVAGAE